MKKKGRKRGAARGAATVTRHTVDIYAMVLTQLNVIVLRMTSAEFDAMLRQGTVEDRQRAARTLLDVQQARLVLGNAVLGDIAEKLKANEQAFVEGEAALDAALDRLEGVEKVLGTIGRFIKLVGGVVTLL